MFLFEASKTRSMFVSLFERQLLLFGCNFRWFACRFVHLIVRMLVHVLLVPPSPLWLLRPVFLRNNSLGVFCTGAVTPFAHFHLSLVDFTRLYQLARKQPPFTGSFAGRYAETWVHFYTWFHCFSLSPAFLQRTQPRTLNT